MQVFPEKIINLWNECEVRVIILLSLVLQIILIIFGNRRKLTANMWIQFIVWSAYLTADWVATVALGNLASSGRDSKTSIPIPNNALQEFWAPFLLLHLGGPDTITAFSLEDNELWLRHFLVLIIQVEVAFYVVLLSWSNTSLSFITIPIFISGVIKYGERTYVLRSSSSKHFRDHVLQSSPESCEDLVKYVEDTKGKRPEGSEEVMVIPQEGIDAEEDRCLVQAYFLFTRSKFFFAEGILDTKEQKRIYSIMKNKPTAEAFKLVAFELGFMYDVFYTKAAIVYSRLGMVFRCITFICSVSALVFFSTTVDVHVYPLIDVSITYLLLVGAVFLELYALILFFLSDWAKLWLIKLKKPQHGSISKTLGYLFWKFCGYFQSLLVGSKRWSASIGQYNLTYCMGIPKLPFKSKWLENMYLTRVDTNIDHLQEKILKYLIEESNKVNKDVSYRRRDLFLIQRGNYALSRERYGFVRNVDKLLISISLEFVDSLIIWHIATTICYYEDLKHNGDESKVDPNCETGKCLSDYMLYLLVFCSFMLPKGIGEVSYKETCDDVITIFKDKRKDISSESKGYESWLQKYPRTYDEGSLDSYTKMGGSQSLLKCGCILYRILQEKAVHKWEMISDFWVEMLVYAAHHCEWKEHAQQLRNGGELLTHVCLLVAHYGLSKQYFHNLLFAVKPESESESEMNSLSDTVEQNLLQKDLERAQDQED